MVSLTLKDAAVDIAELGDKPLLWALRDDLGSSGARYGCGIAQCGACRVLTDGRSLFSHSSRSGNLAGASLGTVEGLLGPDSTLSIAQQVWLDEQMPQRGLRRPSLRIAATDRLARIPNPPVARIEPPRNRRVIRRTADAQSPA